MDGIGMWVICGLVLACGSRVDWYWRVGKEWTGIGVWDWYWRVGKEWTDIGV